MPKYRALTSAQAEQFLENGYIVVGDCFSPETARSYIENAYKRLGYDAQDPSTWREARVHMPGTNWVEVSKFAPNAYDAICDLLGGEERIGDAPLLWGDTFIINFSIGSDRPWQPPSAEVGGWHKDGDFFRHFLDSPEQGLLTIVIWSDILPRSGGTFAALDSVSHVARFLAEHPEGVHPEAFEPQFLKLIGKCNRFIEFTGKVGDVILMHPYLLHTSSQNPSGRPRFITNPPVKLKEPMQFKRADPGSYSLVERATLRGLGVEHLDFRATAPREKVVPEREKIQQKMLLEEQKRKGVSVR